MPARLTFDGAKSWELATTKLCGVSLICVLSTLCESELAALPATLVVRFVCLRLTRRGNRFQNMIVVTTLLDAKRRACWAIDSVVWTALAGGRSEFAASQNDFETGDVNREIP